jgi:hypothetical protein
MRTLPLRVAVVLTLAAVLAPASASAKPPGPPSQLKPQEAREALRLFEQPGFAGIVAARDASVEEVSALAAEAEGLSPTAAVDRVTGAAATDASALATVDCRVVEYATHRGIFPYHRWVSGQTYWCYYYGGTITYRASSTSARVDGVCSGSNARDWKVAGGAGYSWVIVHHEADFSCATPWWYPLNDSLWMEPAFNSYGSTSMTRNS